MLKKIMCLSLAAAVVFLLTACGSSSDAPVSSEAGETVVISLANEEPAQAEQAASEVEEVATVEPQEEATGLGNFDTFTVEFKRAWITEDYEGNPVLAIAYDFTNLDTENSQSFMLATHNKAFQDGIEIDKAYSVADVDSDADSKELKAGATLEVYEAYLLSNTTSVVEVEVSEFLSWDDTVYTFDIDPTTLQ